MEEYTLHSLLDPFQILAVSRRGRIRKVSCPFRVLCKEPVEGLVPNRFYYVGMVGEEDNKLCYEVNDRLYPHSHFLLFIS